MVYAFGFFFGGLAQFVAGILEYPRKNTFATTAFCSYGAFWMSIAIHGTLVAAKVYQPGADATDNAIGQHGEQIMLSVWGVITFIFWLCTFSMNAAISSLFLSLALLFWFLAGGQNPNSQAAVNLKKFAGGWGMLVAAIAFYCAAAQLFEDSYGRAILPTMPFKAINKRQLGSIGTKHFITETPAADEVLAVGFEPNHKPKADPSPTHASLVARILAG